MSGTRILVCQANSCRRAGSEAVLLEIEELAAGGCVVNPSNCLGACDQAPSVAIWKSGRERIFTRIVSVEKSAQVVQAASGSQLNLNDPEMLQRLQSSRQVRLYQEACKESKWNLASAAMSQRSQALKISKQQRLQLQMENGELLCKVGRWEEAAEQLRVLQQVLPENMAITMALAKVLAKLGQVDEIPRLEDHVKRICCDPEDFPLERDLLLQLAAIKTEAEASEKHHHEGCRRIEDYAVWHLEAVTVVSKHSAIYHFVSKDRMRGTPNPRGRGRMVWPKVWHTTLLANIGANSEGPLPWVERDYTPISTSQDWEQGRCSILIKIYLTGQATSWLQQQTLGSKVFLSRPMRTMGVPSLVPELDETAFRPASYLLLLAGTGIVVAAQVLHHCQSGSCFGAHPAITSPIRLVQSCRSDDVLMTSELLQLSKKGTLHSWTLLRTETQASTATPFPDFSGSLTDVASLPNIGVIRSRISKELIQKELSMCHHPCRIVVSGPAGFNAACKEMLQDMGCDANTVTILSA